MTSSIHKRVFSNWNLLLTQQSTMAWLSGGLSQFTDQISSFTKEVLTETTEEVEDPAAELQVAKRKINELESINKHVQSEWEKLKEHSDELTERAETAEYQISTISQEYRKLIHERDEELRRLKVDNASLREQHKGLGASGETHSPLKELAKVNFFQNQDLSVSNGMEYESIDIDGVGSEGHNTRIYGDEFHDFGDVISSQSEINRLQSELARVKVECQHWKTTAQEKGIGDATEVGGSDSEVLLLRDQVKDLQQSLKHEVEHHQRELTALQSVHAEQLHTLSQRHQNETEQLQYKIEQLQKSPHIGSGPSSQLEDEVGVLRQRVGEMEGTQTGYREQLKQLSVENTKMADTNAHLTSQLERENLMTSKLRDELEALKVHFSHEKDTQLQQLELEKQSLVSRLSEMETSIKEQEMSISKLQSEYERSQGEVEQLNSQVENLSCDAREKEVEVVSLKGALYSGGEKSEKTNVELSRALAELEAKTQLEREQVKELAKLGDLLKASEREISGLKEEARKAKGREDTLSTRCTQLDSLLSQEREQLQQNQFELDGLRKRLEPNVLQEELTKTKIQLASELQQTLLERESLREGDGSYNMRDVVSQTEERLKQTESDLATANSSIVELSDALNVLRPQVDILRSTKEQLEARVYTVEGANHPLLRELQAKLEGKQQECDKYSKQLTHLKAHLIEVEEGYTQEALQADGRERGLKQQIADLQVKITGVSIQEDTHSKHTQQQLEGLRKQLQIVEEQRDDALLQMSNAQEQSEQNAAALSNLEIVLEQFQRDQSSELASALKRTQSELADALEQCQAYQKEGKELKAQLTDATSAAETAALLNRELEVKEKEISRLSEEIESLRASISKQTQQQSDLMDRGLVKNLILGYIHTSDRKKPEVLHLIGKILDFSPEELEEAKGVASGSAGWLSGFWKKPTTPSSDKSDSLSQVFVKFLETESVPKPKPLPLNLQQAPNEATPTGYVDPKNDPDRPSLATAAIPRPPSHHNQSASEACSSTTKLEFPQLHSQSFTETRVTTNHSNQPSLLKSVLSK